MTQLESMALTLAIEAVVALLLARRWKMPRAELAPLVVAVFAASLLTHPVAWWINDTLKPWLTYWPRIAVIEVVVVLAEATVLGLAAVVPWRRAFLLALLMNAVSYGTGLAIYYLS